MDPLDEQLAKLKLLNSAPLSPRIYSTTAPQQRVSPSKDKITVSTSSGSAVAALASNFESPRIIIPANSDNDSSSKLSPGGVSPKKVGPIVPPKPNKKQQTNFPEVPQSIVVKQTCEPLYSKRLQSNGGSGLSKTAASRAQPQQQQQQRVPIISPSSKLTTSRAPILHRKQPIYATQNNIYGNNSTVTLDNPAILDQQLEALAHHKKQLEKKGLLMQQQQTHQQHYHDVPKLSSASFLSDLNRSAKGANSLSHKNVLYTNIRQGTEIAGEMGGESLNVYGNIGGPQHLHHLADNNLQSEGLGAAFVYSNLQYGGGNGLDDLPPPPPAVLSISTADPSEYLSHGNPNDDEIPPPPSPVSSSYSELRRATDIFPKLSLPVQTVNNMQQHSQTASITSNGSGGKLHHQHGLQHSLALDNGNPASVCSNGTVSGAGHQQTYMNMGYHHNNDYSTYVGSPSSQGSSTYESIYEPINPRPPSQLSSRSNYMMYAPYVNGPQASDCSSTGNMGVDNCMSGSTMTLSSVGGMGSIPRHHQQQSANGKLHNHKEAEVEALTDLLVHSMDSGNDSDSFGVCVTCNERVVGENSGCTAMDQVFHIACFTCCQCQINLQGKPFYALEGKPYCEYDYLQTLEKCSVCMKPILERILRATGKPYHPQCFTCVVCGNSLDGIPFTVDATNQNYCIADFHKKFAPRCCVCKLPIMPEAGQEETVRVVALDRSFHFECYKCEDCGLLLSSEAEGRGCYPLDDHVLCKSCNAKRVQTLTNRMTTEL